MNYARPEPWRRYSLAAQILDEMNATSEAIDVLEAGMSIQRAQKRGNPYARLLHTRARLLSESGEGLEAKKVLRAGLEELDRIGASTDERERLSELLRSLVDELPSDTKPQGDDGWAGPGISPLRWVEIEEEGRTFLRPVLADLPSGPSRMNPNAQKEARERISATEETLAELYPDRPRERAPDPVVERILYLEPGRELWALQTERDGIAYIVEAESTVQPGAGMRIVGPYNYHKEPLTSHGR